MHENILIIYMYIDYLLENNPNYDSLVTLCQLKGSTVLEILKCGTHPKEEKQEEDSKENTTLLNMCGTLKNLPCSMTISGEYRSKFVATQL